MSNFHVKKARKDGPEAKIQHDIISMLRMREWYVKSTHGNAFQFGFPDLYTSHFRYGARWIEVKNLESYSFTGAQLEEFPKMSAAGVGIWILVAATEHEYKKLFGPPNWQYYLQIMR